MATTNSRGKRTPRRALKSPLAVHSARSGTGAIMYQPDVPDGYAPYSGMTDREATLSEFQGYLRTVNNRNGMPYEEKTIIAYSNPRPRTWTSG